MFAKIIPLKRLPKRLGLFDYAVPETIRGKISEGQLVKIPFRKSTIFGLVFSVSGEPSAPELKEVSEIVNEIPILNPIQKKFWQFVSMYYGLALGNTLLHFLPPLQKRKIAQTALRPIETTVPCHEDLSKKCIHLYDSEKGHTEFLQKNVTPGTLILLPEVRHIESIYNLLPVDIQQKTLVWHAGQSVKEQFEVWFKIRNGENNIVIGTRSAVFLPFETLQNIIVDFEADENHKHWDQMPRYHVKDVAELLAEIHKCRIFYSGFSLSLASYFEIHKDFSNFVDAGGSQIAHIPSLEPNSKLKSFSLVNMQNERRGGNYDLMSDKIQNAILQSAGNIVVITSRLGLATSVGCKECSYIEECNNCCLPLVYHNDGKLHCHHCKTYMGGNLSCPKCASPLVEMRGIGTETTEKFIRKLTKNAREIIRIDSERKEVQKIDYSKKVIVVGTMMAISLVELGKFKTVIITDIDRQLGVPEFRASEEAWELLQEILYCADDGAEILVQTKNPDHMVLRSLKEPDRFYRSELNLRKKLNYPPYSYLVRYLYGHEAQRSALYTTSCALRELTNALIKEKKHVTLSTPIETQPKFLRGKYWYEIIAKFDRISYYSDVLWVNQFFGEDWKIDPNPISLLSPS